MLVSIPALAQAPVKKVEVRPQAISAARDAAPKSVKKNKACVAVDAIAGAVVTDDQTVELSLKDGSRWRMAFANPCPALGYYQGFYYRRAKAQFLCAGHDAVMARSGGECPISSLSRTKKPRRKR